MDSTTFLGEEIQTELATRPNMELRNRPSRMEAYTKDRDDLLTPSKLTAAYLCSSAGTDLDAIEPFTHELMGIVDTMKEQLASEARLLEGVEVPEYGKGAWTHIAPPSLAEALSIPPTTTIPNGIRTTTYQVSGHCASCGKDSLVFFGTADEVKLCSCGKNELSQSETKETQWKTHLQPGCWTTGPTPISPPASSSSSSIARPNSPASPLELSNGRSSPSSTVSCSGKEGDCGCAIDAMNECSVCTVPTISEPTLGTPSVPK